MAVTQNSITLGWFPATDNVGVTGYKVYLVDNIPPTEIADVGNVLTYNVTGLTPNTDYSFMIKAYDVAGNHSEYGNQVFQTTLE